MVKRFTRQQLYAFVWERPMTKLAAEFGISDVALHKFCRKHRVPTPPAGHWAKKTRGKRVATTPLPDPSDTTEIVIREGSSLTEPQTVAEARLAMLAEAKASAPGTGPNPIVERTLNKVAKMRKGTDGFVRRQTDIWMSVRPDTLERAGKVLRQFVAAGEKAGLRLTKESDGALGCAMARRSRSSSSKFADQVEHVATEKELAGRSEMETRARRPDRGYGYWRDWGEPKISKWEQRFQGRLAIKLEEVRVQSERSWWGDAVRRTFSDTRTRDIGKAIPEALASVAAIAAAKKHNRDMEACRDAVEREAARQRVDMERRGALDQKALHFVEEIVSENAEVDRLRSVLTLVGEPSVDHPPHCRIGPLGKRQPGRGQSAARKRADRAAA